MRFRSKGPPRGELFSLLHRRIVLAVAGALVLVLILLASGRGTWFAQLMNGERTEPRPAPVSERLMGGTPLAADEFQVVPNDAGATADRDAAHIDAAGVRAMESDSSPVTSGPDQVPEALTQSIRDDVIGVLATESAAWFGTLKLAGGIRPIDEADAPEGQFALLMDSPQSCRGRAYSLRGRLRRLTRAQLPESAETFGIRSVYDAWISTRDSGNQLVHVVAISADPGLPITEDAGKTGADVQLTGYFFKREGYAARGQDGLGDLALTPLILAGRIRVLPPSSISSRADQMNPWLMWIGLGILCGVLVLVWQFQMSDHVFRGTRTHQLAAPPVKPSFDGVQVVTIEEALHEMEQSAQSVSVPTLL